MPTFIVENNPEFSRPISLSAEDEKHITRVLRARIGETITVTDNCGHLAVCEITALNPLNFRVEKIFDGEPALPLTVCLPLIDQTRMEWAIEKLTELNVAAAQLMITDRTQQNKISENKFARLQKTALAAQKQCGRATPLLISPPSNLSKLLNEQGLRIAALPESTDKINAIPALPLSQNARLYVGPEGGFSEEEILILNRDNVISLNLGGTVLRAETATVVAAGIIKTSFIRKPK